VLTARAGKRRRFASWSVVTATALGLVLLGGWPQSSGALGLADRLIGVQGIGGLSLDAPYGAALKHFGSEGVESLDLGGCELRYPQLGLTLWWVGDPLTRGTRASCQHFQEGAVVGKGWHTKKGLAIGDPTSKLVRLYPHAYDTRRAGPKWSARGSTQWDITITCCGGGERPALSVMVERGRIVAMFVEMVGH
jgi:hypothetical protein